MFDPFVIPVEGESPDQILLNTLADIHGDRGNGKVIVVSWNSHTNKGCAAIQKTLELKTERDVQYLKFNVKSGFLHFLGTRRKLAV